MGYIAEMASKYKFETMRLNEERIIYESEGDFRRVIDVAYRLAGKRFKTHWLKNMGYGTIRRLPFKTMDLCKPIEGYEYVLRKRKQRAPKMPSITFKQLENMKKGDCKHFYGNKKQFEGLNLSETEYVKVWDENLKFGQIFRK